MHNTFYLCCLGVYAVNSFCLQNKKWWLLALIKTIENNIFVNFEHVHMYITIQHSCKQFVIKVVKLYCIMCIALNRVKWNNSNIDIIIILFNYHCMHYIIFMSKNMHVVTYCFRWFFCTCILHNAFWVIKFGQKTWVQAIIRLYGRFNQNLIFGHF